MNITSHQLAKLLLEKPDAPVAVGRNLGIYSVELTTFRISPESRLLFDADKPVKDEVKKEVIWICGSPLI